MPSSASPRPTHAAAPRPSSVRAMLLPALLVVSALLLVLGAAPAPAQAAGSSFTMRAFPTPTSRLPTATTPLIVHAGETRDFHDASIRGTTTGRSEFQLPVVLVEPGGTVENLIVEDPAADGIHCVATCTLRNVWWTAVGEDAATLNDGSPASAVMTVVGGGARHAHDKVFQVDGAGTVIVEDFAVLDIGTLIRSCGQCVHQQARHLIVRDVFIDDGKYKVVGVNVNYGDTARISDVTIRTKARFPMAVCQESNGHTARPADELPAHGPDAHCSYDPASIVFIR